MLLIHVVGWFRFSESKILGSERWCRLSRKQNRPRVLALFRNTRVRAHCDEAKGNLIPDAYHAALAIEYGCQWISLDRGFSRFPRLQWRHPLNSSLN